MTPWIYEHGVFPGSLNGLIGKGSAGWVFDGKLKGAHAAFKFVRIGEIHFQDRIVAGLANLETRLAEWTAMNAAAGTSVLKMLGHFRLVDF